MRSVKFNLQSDGALLKIKCPVLIFLVSIVLFSCGRKEPDLTCERIDYLFDIKSKAAEKYWVDFNRKTLFSPMLYYTRTGLYTINANKSLKNRIDIEPRYCGESKVKIGFSKVVDTMNFYMNVSYDDLDPKALEYKNTLGMFSDVSLTEKFIPDVKDTEEWMSMVIHEMFHQYQRSFNEFRYDQVASKKEFNRDTLNYLFKNRTWFNAMVKRENQLLLEVLEQKDKDSIKRLLMDYLTKKQKRLAKVAEEEGLYISNLENSLSKSEGTARFMEYCVKLTLQKAPQNLTLSGVDDKYLPNRFEDYDITKDKWMYGLGGGYYYSIGFNLTRVLEKLEMDYQRDIFLRNRPFDFYLNEYIE